MTNLISYGYLYPIKGIFYTMGNPSLWQNTLLPITFSLLCDILFLVLIFVYGYNPQFEYINDLLSFFWEWLNHVITVVIALLESYIFSMIIINVFLGYYFEKAFDKVLYRKGHGQLVDGEDGNCLKSILRAVRLFQILKIIISIITLPLNFIPTIGCIIYIYINGILQAWDQQDRYFELKKIDGLGVQWRFIKKHYSKMSGFGFVSFFLESLPLIGVVFNITNAVGIALYDCALEDKLLKSSLRNGSANINV